MTITSSTPTIPTVSSVLEVERARQRTRSSVRDEGFRDVLVAFAEHSPDFIGWADLDGRLVHANPAGARLCGVGDAEQLRGMWIEDLLTPRARSGALAALQTVLGEGQATWDTEVLNRSTGEGVAAEQTVFLIESALGVPEFMATVIRDVRALREAQSERERLLEAERTARAEAERYARMQDEFLATLSHELRTPLTAILGWAHVLAAETPGTERLARGLAVIQRTASLQARLIDDLLEVSRLATGKLLLGREPLDLEALVRQGIEAVQQAAAAKKLVLTLRVEGTVPMIWGDRTRLEQVFGNLLGNALKFTPAGGSVTVSLAGASDAVVVEVADTGEGIAPDFLPHVFERFRQADSGSTREHGGLGLGLTLVRQLVELHQGTVTVQSEGKGKGAVLTVRLPVLDETADLEGPT